MDTSHIPPQPFKARETRGGIDIAMYESWQRRTRSRVSTSPLAIHWTRRAGYHLHGCLMQSAGRKPLTRSVPESQESTPPQPPPFGLHSGRLSPCIDTARRSTKWYVGGNASYDEFELPRVKAMSGRRTTLRQRIQHFREMPVAECEYEDNAEAVRHPGGRHKVSRRRQDSTVAEGDDMYY